MSEPTSKVSVFVRVRPLLAQMREEFCVKCAKKATEDTLCLTHPVDDSANSGKQTNYTYNSVFDDEDTQEDVYEAVRDLVDSCLDGHNATIFTYGQTGSGKTHTVLGKVVKDPETDMMVIGPNTGMFMRVLDDLLRYRKANQGHSHVVISLSILEIYNEQIRDLLHERRVMDLRVNKRNEESVPNLRMREVETLEDCFEVYSIGTSERAAQATAMNPESSRSHAVFLIEVIQQEKGPDAPNPPSAAEIYKADFETSAPEPAVPVKRSRLCLVDLAGSERLKKSEAEGMTMKETQAINTSLSTLGKVVNALYKGKKHISYRDSKLTMLLKPSFEKSNAKVLVICNISPIDRSYQETNSSLLFADNVMGLQKKQVFTIDMETESEYMRSLEQVSLLTADLRLAMAAHEFSLLGGKRIKELKKKHKGLSERAIAQLKEEQAEREGARVQMELEELTFKLTNKRPMVEQRASKHAEERAMNLKLVEQDLLAETFTHEALNQQEGLEVQKAVRDVLKGVLKSGQKSIKDLDAKLQSSLLDSLEPAWRSLQEETERFGCLLSGKDRKAEVKAKSSAKERSATPPPSGSGGRSRGGSKRQKEGPGGAGGAGGEVPTPDRVAESIKNLEDAQARTVVQKQERAQARQEFEERLAKMRAQADKYDKKKKKKKKHSKDHEEGESDESEEEKLVSVNRDRQMEIYEMSGLSEEQVELLMSRRK